jgi:hypothetical protein|tara:strand:- start:119 stop:304 length:186 start_codon:yes stop_codon:yes gene_type:complete
MNADKLLKDKIKGIVELALEDFSVQQVNLSSKTARQAISLRVTSDIFAAFNLGSPQDRDLA